MFFDVYRPADVAHHHDHHVVSFTAKNSLTGDPLSKELEALRTSTLQSADINSARKWGEKLKDLQENCFINHDQKACKLINRELGKAAGLFGDLARATKHASEDAMSAIAGAAKMSSMVPLGLMTVAVASAQPVKPQNAAQFL